MGLDEYKSKSDSNGSRNYSTSKKWTKSKVLKSISKAYDEYGHSPTKRELKDMFGSGIIGGIYSRGYFKNPKLTNAKIEANVPIGTSKLPEDIIDESLVEYIEGHLLGDGTISIPSGSNTPIFQLTDKNKEYTLYLYNNIFPKILFSEDYEPIKHMNNGREYWKISTKVCPDFIDIYNDWYDDVNEESKKVLPESFKLTPKKLLFWYIGDGSLEMMSSKYPDNRVPKIHIKWASEDSINELLEQVRDMVGKASLHKGREDEYKIYIPSSYRYDFFKVIGECPVSCYDYKWLDVNNEDGGGMTYDP